MKKVVYIGLVLALVGLTIRGPSLVVAQEDFEDGSVENYTEDELWGEDFYEYDTLGILSGLKEGTVVELNLFNGNPDDLGAVVASNNFIFGKASLRHAFNVLFDVAGDADYDHLVITAGDKSQTSYMHQDKETFMRSLY